MPAAAEKLTARHLARRAYVYVRQSSPKQVQQHRESQRNQYALVERARALGWPAERVHVVDCDQGQSGQDGDRRGFQQVVSEVSLGRVGIVLAYEASRLARNNADWYALLDLAALVGTLIADADGVYDPRSYNDRLLLGLRGMLSEAELHLLRLRLDAGRLRQVERGAYRQRLPTGLVRLDDGRVVKDPDQQVQRTIAMVFERFAALGTCQKVLRALRDAGVLLPRRQYRAAQAGELSWKAPAEAAIYDILRNPAYAGAFVYGRHGPAPDRRPGRPNRLVDRPMAEWATVRHGVYPAYLEWGAFVQNQQRLADNASNYATRMRGAPREGAALLVGLAACGRCGRLMRVAYKPQVRYFCNALCKAYGAASCLHLDGAGVEAAVVAAFFAAIQPAELAVLDDVLAQQRAEREQVAQHHADQVARATYEARLAERRYRASDPEHRLVAAELERQWELALRALAEAREVADRHAAQPVEPALAPDLREQLADFGRRLPDLWDSGRLTPGHKKALLRALIRRVALSRPRPDAVEVKVIWVSGAFSLATVRPPIHRAADAEGYERMVDRVLELSAEGVPDREIARRLREEGFRSARTAGIPDVLVGKLRRARRQLSVVAQFRSQAKVDGRWTVRGLARELGVDRDWIYRRLRTGAIPASRHPRTGHFLIDDDPETLAALVPRRALPWNR
jgi:DNA invertase Pin-like site-specific DNA recombinase